MFARLTKVDAAKRELWGVMAAEETDRAGETFDYDSSKPYFEEWSATVQKISDGKSLGNVRAMHATVAAGKLISIEYDDAAKKIFVGAKIVDDGEWAKCEAGVYTGFSLGGDYMRRWNTGGAKKYTARPVECTLADIPCMPSATFELVKVDGLSEQRNFKPTTETKPTPKTPEALPMLEAKQLLKSVLAGSLPADMSMGELRKQLDAGTLKKGLYAVGTLALALDNLRFLQADASIEALVEQDNSKVPGKLKDAMEILADALVMMAEEESREALPVEEDLASQVAKVLTQVEEPVVDVNKIAGLLSKLTQDEKEQVFKALGVAAPAPAAAAPVAEPAAAAVPNAEVEALKKVLEGMTERLAKIEGAPLPAKDAGTGSPAAPVAKGEEIEEAPASDEPVVKTHAPNEATRLMKIAHRSPVPVTPETLSKFATART